MAQEEEGRDNILHERISMLEKEGYRGFKLKQSKKKWGGVSVTVKNSDGRTVTESGETSREAAKKIIDKIDTILD
ncbi:hypothetical protein G3570_07935 [Balneolaceae bacterium YR4-1]|uniref:Uncharacterized protein n=1 Tax=Halalkalibaculum roseum TaxID=2709311 RepID=A0A6M1SWM5_9BACT|nr:hypothetical protein [Halalkalibaculum roseum]NGP76558.1 hypothetical protein [Halalkalibaculum roseum]